MSGVLKKVAVGTAAGLAVGLCAVSGRRRDLKNAALRARIERQERELQAVRSKLARTEGTLADQMVSVGLLRDHARDNDSNLQKLLAAVERLIAERTPSPSSTLLPFETHLAEATERAEGAEPAEPRVRVIKESANEKKRPRFPLARTF